MASQTLLSGMTSLHCSSVAVGRKSARLQVCANARYTSRRHIECGRLFTVPRCSAQGGKRSSVRLSAASINEAVVDTSVDGGSGNGASGGSGNGGSNGGGDGQGASGGSSGAEILLLGLGRSLESLPKDMANAIQAGKMPVELLQRYLDLEKNVVLKFLLSIGGFRDRMLGDSSFLVKVGIEVGIGLAMKCAAELNKRGENFNAELDFVFANVLMALCADFMLVWLPAPTASFRPAAPRTQSALAKFFANCPDNAFQMVPAGRAPFTGAQRVGAVARNGFKLLGVGAFSSLLGVGVTNALLALRQALDPEFHPQNAPQNVLAASAAYASYMATSSNLRYQVIAGVLEERGIERIFAGNSSLCHILSFVIRTGNTFLGSLMWVDYLRLLGMQKAPTPKAILAVPEVKADGKKKKK